MISISREYTFEAAHSLPYVPEGHRCRRVHGHNYRVVVTVKGKGEAELGGLAHPGWVMDFADLDARVLPLLQLIDHTNLNDTIHNPTAELLAVWIAAGVVIADRVRVYETDTCWAEWSADNVSA